MVVDIPGAALEVEPALLHPEDATALGDLVVPDDGLTILTDATLTTLVRGGSTDAYAVLFERYRHPATRLAAYFSNPHDAKDIVAETFAQVLHQLRQGQGPQTSFRSYLLTAVRREAGRRARMMKRVTPTDDDATIDRPVPFGNGAMDRFERDLVRAAFASLPERWRTVLWHLDVEGLKPAELAATMGLKPNSVSALAYRAREGMRKAYLEQHVAPDDGSQPTACQNVRHRLAGFVRGSATVNDVTAIDPHIEVCAPCMGVYLELEEVNTSFGAVTTAAALALAAPAGTGLLGGLIAKAAIAAKSAVVLVGSTAAVVATSTVLHVAPVGPAQANAPLLPPSSSVQHEPDRSIGPATDGANTQERESSPSAPSIADRTAQAPAVTPAGIQPSSGTTPDPSPAPNSATKPRASANLDAGLTSSVTVDRLKPLDADITIKSPKEVTLAKADTQKFNASGKDKIKNLAADAGLD